MPKRAVTAVDASIIAEDAPPRSTPMLARGPERRTIYRPAFRAHRGRHSGPLPDLRIARRYWVITGVLIVIALTAAAAVFTWDNPAEVGSESFYAIVAMRGTTLLVMAIVAFAQSIATVAFHTVTNNRIITPGIMGFESLYRVIQTGFVFVLGAAGVMASQGTVQFLLQILVMVGFSALLYGWLLTGKHGNLQVMLLVGIILGGGLGALATFMQRLLNPSDFDILTARLIGSIANADASYLPVAIPLVALAGGALWFGSTRLNVLALGRDTAINLGVNHKHQTMVVLLLVSVLMAVSTALVGPMMFLGFLVAMIAYQLADTHDHRYVFPMAWLTGFVVLASSYFVVKHVFYAQGSVGIIIEIVGGTFFLIHVLRKGRL